jgi:DNA-binding response OmpR family regulator
MENSYRILLAEDEPKLSQVVQEELTRQGYMTDVAYDGSIAESYLSNMLTRWCCSI